MTFRGHRVGDLITALKILYPGQVPATWYVHDATPWAKNQVLLFVGRTPQAVTHPARAGHPPIGL